jgi:hypothetical protein
MVLWVLWPPVLVILLLFAVQLCGIGIAQLYTVKFLTATREFGNAELGQFNSLTSVSSLVANVPLGLFVDRYVLGSRWRLALFVAAQAALNGAAQALPLVTAAGSAGKPALYAIAVLAGVAASAQNIVYFAILLRVSDKRFSATAFSIFTMITNAAGGPVAKLCAIQIITAFPGPGGIERCLWIGAAVTAGAGVIAPFYVLPPIDGPAEGADAEGGAGGAGGQGGAAEGEKMRLNPIVAASGADADFVATENPFAAGGGRSEGSRKERAALAARGRER